MGRYAGFQPVTRWPRWMGFPAGRVGRGFIQSGIMAAPVDCLTWPRSMVAVFDSVYCDPDRIQPVALLPSRVQLESSTKPD